MDSFKAAAWWKDSVSDRLVDNNRDCVETRKRFGSDSGDLGCSENIIRVFLDRCSGFASPRSQRGEAGRGGEGDAAQAHVQAVDLGGDRHLGEEGAVPGQPDQSSATAAAVAALDVFDDVEDLLTLRLPSHPSDVQDGWHVLLPEHREERREWTGVKQEAKLNQKHINLYLYESSEHRTQLNSENLRMTKITRPLLSEMETKRHFSSSVLRRHLLKYCT